MHVAKFRSLFNEVDAEEFQNSLNWMLNDDATGQIVGIDFDSGVTQLNPSDLSVDGLIRDITNQTTHYDLIVIDGGSRDGSAWKCILNTRTCEWSYQDESPDSQACRLMETK